MCYTATNTLDDINLITLLQTIHIIIIKQTLGIKYLGNVESCSI